MFGTIEFLFDALTLQWVPAPARPFFMTGALIAAVYVFYVRPKIRQYRIVTGILDAVDGGAKTLWGRIWALFSARFSGYKTVILGSAAAILPTVPPVLDELHGFAGWDVFLDQGLANKVSAILAALTAVTHIYGLVSAAKAVPVDYSPPPSVANEPRP